MKYDTTTFLKIVCKLILVGISMSVNVVLGCVTVVESFTMKLHNSLPDHVVKIDLSDWINNG